jgi:hypothetical protein
MPAAKKTKKVARKKQGKLGRVLNFFNPRSLKGGMALFALIFAVAGGGYYVYRSFASSVLTMSMVGTKDTKGYYLLHVDGGIRHYGSAVFRGNPKQDGVTGKVFVDMALSGTGNGYWIMAESGKVYAYGDAAKISTPESGGPYVAIVPTPAQGFWLVTKLGIAIPYGDAATTYKLDTSKKNYTDGGFGTIKGAVGIVDADRNNKGTAIYLLDITGKVYGVGADFVERGGIESAVSSTVKAASISAQSALSSYILTTTKGHIAAHGAASAYRGGWGDQTLSAGIRRIEKFGSAADNSDGYWVVTAAGVVYKAGKAVHYGDTSSVELAPVFVDHCLLDIKGNIKNLQNCLNQKGAKLAVDGNLTEAVRKECSARLAAKCPHPYVPPAPPPPPPPPGCPKPGGTAALCLVQTALNVEIAKPGGIDTRLEVDGVWGEKTKAACEAFKTQVSACNQYLNGVTPITCTSPVQCDQLRGDGGLSNFNHCSNAVREYDELLSLYTSVQDSVEENELAILAQARFDEATTYMAYARSAAHLERYRGETYCGPNPVTQDQYNRFQRWSYSANNKLEAAQTALGPIFSNPAGE